MAADMVHKYGWPNTTAMVQTVSSMECNETSSNFSCPESDDGSIVDDSISTYISIFFILLFGLIGLIGNGTLVLIVILNREMRNVPNVLIASLALGDFLFLLVSVPFTVISYLHNTFIFGEGICKLISMLPIMSERVSVFTLAAMSHDRYTAIVKPMHRRKSHAAMRIYAVAITIWIISFALSIPSLVLSFVEDSWPPYHYCFYLPHNTRPAKIHEAFRCVLMFILPLLVISVYYVLIALKLLESSLNMPGEGVAETGQATKQVRARRRLARTVLVLVVLFGVCWLPHFIYRLPDHVTDEEGALMEPLAVAVYSCERGGVTSGSRLLICGAGPIGLLTMMTAKAMGAAEFILTDIDDHRLEIAKQYGATHTINMAGLNSDDIATRVLDTMNGDPPDIAMECSGSDLSLVACIHATGAGGSIVLVGRGSLDVSLPLVEIAGKELDINGIFRYANAYPKALAMLSSGSIDVKSLVTHRFSLQEAEMAFKTASSRDSKAIKVMISCS